MSGHSEAQLSLGLNSNGAFKYALFDEYIVTVRQTTRAWVYPAAAVRICAMHPLERGETAKPAKTKEEPKGNMKHDSKKQLSRRGE